MSEGFSTGSPSPYGGPVPSSPPGPNPYDPQRAQAPDRPPPMPVEFYASFGDRAMGALWDFLYLVPPMVVMLGSLALAPLLAWLMVMAGLGHGASAAVAVVMLLGFVAGTAWAFWRTVENLILDQGRTGWTYGKRKVGLQWVKEIDGTPPGGGNAFVKWLIRQGLGIIDVIWPLWDPRRQTVGDKALNTIVIYRRDPAGEKTLF